METRLQDLVRVVIAVHSHVVVVELHHVAAARRHELPQAVVDLRDHVAVVVHQHRALQDLLLQTVRCRVVLLVHVLTGALRDVETHGDERFFLDG